MCRRVLLVVLWLLIGTRSCLLVVGLLSIAEALCPSLCLFGTILVTPCLMVWDWRVSRADPMLSCWHDLLFLFCLLLFYLFLPSMGWLCGVWVFGLIECPHSRPALHSGLQNNNNNNKRDQNCTACSRCWRTRDLYNGRISSLLLYLKLRELWAMNCHGCM